MCACMWHEVFFFLTILLLTFLLVFHACWFAGLDDLANFLLAKIRRVGEVRSYRRVGEVRWGEDRFSICISRHLTHVLTLLFPLSKKEEAAIHNVVHSTTNT